MKLSWVSKERAYTEGPVTEVAWIRIEAGHFEEYVDWLNSTARATSGSTILTI